LRHFVALSPAACLQLTRAPIRCIALNDKYAALDTRLDIQHGLEVRIVARDNPDAASLSVACSRAPAPPVQRRRKAFGQLSHALHHVDVQSNNDRRLIENKLTVNLCLRNLRSQHRARRNGTTPRTAEAVQNQRS